MAHKHPHPTTTPAATNKKDEEASIQQPTTTHTAPQETTTTRLLLLPAEPPNSNSSNNMAATATASSVKENDGRGARRRTVQRRLVVLLTGAATALLTLWLARKNGGSSTAATANSGAAAATKERQLQLRRKNSNSRMIGGGGGGGPSQSQLDRILSGALHLVEIRVAEEELRQSQQDNNNSDSGGDYDGIYGTFCRLDWKLHKGDPSSYPMFRDLVGHSVGCDEEHRVRDVNLRHVAERARQLDASGGSGSGQGGAASVLELAAVVFHESRCGSTLTANLLAAYDPAKHRVYSESAPPLQALKQVCGEAYERCPVATAAAVLRDVVYLMRRSDDPAERRAFFKIQSAGSRNLEVFQLAFPETPYLFVYRDPVQVMVSHLKQGRRNANCVRQQRNPPAVVESIVRKHSNRGQSARRLSPEDYCAAHLASITETVADRMTERGVPVNYDQLPEALYDRILPRILGIDAVPPESLQRMRAAAAVYSKGRGDRAGEFVEDSQAKEEAASPAVKAAAAAYLQASFDRLEELAAAAEAAP